MKSIYLNREQYLETYAAHMYHQYMRECYGVTMAPVGGDPVLYSMRKELLDVLTAEETVTVSTPEVTYYTTVSGCNVCSGQCNCSSDSGSGSGSSGYQTLQETWVFLDSPVNADEKPTGSEFQDNLLKTVTLHDILYVNGTPMNWRRAGVTLSTVTGTLDFSPLGADFFQQTDPETFLTLQYSAEV